MTKVKPILRGTFHQAMFFIAIGACTPLIVKSSNASEYVATSIYSAAVMMMFGFSALYHRFDWNRLTKKRMRKLVIESKLKLTKKSKKGYSCI